MYNDKKIAVIIAAAGSGKRMGGGIPKQYGMLGGMSILGRTVKAFAELKEVDWITIVTNEAYMDRCRKEMKRLGMMRKVKEILPGGQERQDSIYQAVRRIPEDVDLVLVHDGVRPFVSGDLIHRTIEAAVRYGAAAVAVPVKDTIKMAEENVLTKTLDRKRLYAVQTPQGFRRELLVSAYHEAYRGNYYGTDDAFLVEKTGEKVYLVKGDYNNIKITTMEDILFGEAILSGRIEEGTGAAVGPPADTDTAKGMNMSFDKAVSPGSGGEEIRVGTGYDVHRLVPDRKLILGGVEIPFEKGLLGHSDADVLTHTIMDALLGAAALGDIGRHFPDSDESYRDISSLLLLKRVKELLAERGYRIGNIDAVVIAQKPKIAPYIGQMISRVAETLEIEENRINIKGTTTEKLGFCGREEGIAAQASVLIRR